MGTVYVSGGRVRVKDSLGSRLKVLASSPRPQMWRLGPPIARFTEMTAAPVGRVRLTARGRRRLSSSSWCSSPTRYRYRGAPGSHPFLEAWCP